MIYLDASVLVELYLGGPRAAEARRILDQDEPKGSSFLLMVEVPVALRRTLADAERREDLARCLARFDGDLDDIGLVDSLTDVAIRVRSDSRFASCRSLDAVHACTALLLREWTGTEVRVATFDQRLAKLAGRLGIGWTDA